MNRVTVVGAGLAGCEAAWQLARRGIPVRLVDMKPKKHSPAHTLDSFSELVCSNSLKAEQLTNASGLLKAEMACGFADSRLRPVGARAPRAARWLWIGKRFPSA